MGNNGHKLPEILRPKNGDCLVSRTRTLLAVRGPSTQPGDFSVTELSMLHAVVDTYFLEVEWVPIVQWKNCTFSTTTWPLSAMTRFATRNDGRVSEQLGIASMMQDLTIRFEDIHKSLLAQETTSSSTTDIQLEVPTGSSVAVYQKRWRFKHVIWFITKNGQEEKVVTIGNPTPGYPATRGGFGSEKRTVVKETRVEISISSFVDSSEYVVDKTEKCTNKVVREVNVTPAREEYLEDLKEVTIRNIPKEQQSVIVSLLG